eukprot:751212-Hanusia_phi.AAC.1
MGGMRMERRRLEGRRVEGEGAIEARNDGVQRRMFLSIPTSSRLASPWHFLQLGRRRRRAGVATEVGDAMRKSRSTVQFEGTMMRMKETDAGR